MPRKESKSDFFVDVDDVGQFTFARRNMRDELDIQVQYARMLDGVTPTDWLGLVAGWISTLRVLTVKAPDGWDLDSMDPLDDDTYSKLARVNRALAAKEADFRKGKKAEGEGKREEAGGDSGVLVPEPLPPDS